MSCSLPFLLPLAPIVTFSIRSPSNTNNLTWSSTCFSDISLYVLQQYLCNISNVAACLCCRAFFMASHIRWQASGSPWRRFSSAVDALRGSIMVPFYTGQLLLLLTCCDWFPAGFGPLNFLSSVARLAYTSLRARLIIFKANRSVLIFSLSYRNELIFFCKMMCIFSKILR